MPEDQGCSLLLEDLCKGWIVKLLRALPAEVPLDFLRAGLLCSPPPVAKDLTGDWYRGNTICYAADMKGWQSREDEQRVTQIATA